MPPPSPSRATALRSCVVNAVRESEALMARLVQATTDALGQQEQEQKQEQPDKPKRSRGVRR